MTNNKSIELLKDKAIGAILGAACGDALGWPNERITRSNFQRQPQGPLQEFKQWTRHAGGRFFPYEEVIKPGEYSDDTQLILCLSRSFQFSQNWWKHWTIVELPFWTLYERGGGGATKRAADAWIDGNAPWSSKRNPKDIKSYFDAGGNGVAMRVLPHVLNFANSQNYEQVAMNIMLDGITTHGHPRALVGALAYGYALWKSVQKESQLGYGKIVEDLLANIREWSALPKISDLHKDFYQQADRSLSSYQRVWEAAVRELESSLFTCKNELDKGVLAIDDEVLRDLKCFDRKISGAGTVATAATVYLASRYAPDPIHGLIKAAFAIGSDTDTIASMTGGLLGIICGSEWLSTIKERVQDSVYLVRTAQSLVCPENLDYYKNLSTGSIRATLNKWIENLISKPEGEKIQLLDGRQGTIYGQSDQVGRSGQYKVKLSKVITDDGQSLYFTKISKGKFQSSSIQKTLFPKHEAKLNSKNFIFGVKIPVQSFERAIWFYKNILGLQIKKQSHDLIVFEQGLALVPYSYYSNHLRNIRFCSLLYVEVTEIEKRFSLIKDNSLEIITPISLWEKSNRFFFRCLDLDGNVVEVFGVEIK